MLLRSELLAWMMGFSAVYEDDLRDAFGYYAWRPLQDLIELGLVRISTVGYLGRRRFTVREVWGDRF